MGEVTSYWRKCAAQRPRCDLRWVREEEGKRVEVDVARALVGGDWSALVGLDLWVSWSRRNRQETKSELEMM